MGDVSIAGAAALKAERHPAPEIDTHRLLAQVFHEALESAGLKPGDVDGLGVSSFSIRPDRAIDLAWHLGVSLRWVMEDIVGMNMVHHAARAIEAGDASTIVLVAGDLLMGANYGALVEGYNTAHRDHLTPIDVGGPNALFSLITQNHMQKYGLGREAYGRVVINQRAWAGTNPNAAYRKPLSMEEYLAAPLVADPLGLFDCPPIVAGAEAVVLTSSERAGRKGVAIKAIRSVFNYDHQEGDGLRTGLADLAGGLYEESGHGPEDVDVVGIYDDYPVIVLVHLEDLGFIQDGCADELLVGPGGPGPAVNPSGGLLTAGQSGAGGGLHGLVECVRQLRGERGDGQVPSARVAVVAGYGMVLYRYASCSVAAVLEAA